MIAALLLGTVLVSQCECQPAVLGPPIYSRIKYSGEVYSKFYAKGILPSGRVIEVPIVNGLAPQVTTQMCDGYEYRLYNFDCGSLYKGKLIEFQAATPCGERPTTPPAVTVPAVPIKPPATPSLAPKLVPIPMPDVPSVETKPKTPPAAVPPSSDLKPLPREVPVDSPYLSLPKGNFQPGID